VPRVPGSGGLMKTIGRLGDQRAPGVPPTRGVRVGWGGILLMDCNLNEVGGFVCLSDLKRPDQWQSERK
jgi:hypothetical protein